MYGLCRYMDRLIYILVCISGYLLTPCADAQVFAHRVTPLRTITSLPSRLLNNIEGHLQEGHIYSDSDYITYAHGTTHGVNSRYRQIYSGNYNALYIFDNLVIFVNEPPARLTVIGQKVPQSLRGPIYNTYMVKQAASWDDTPTYVLDELVSYSNGAWVGRELKNYKRADESLGSALEMGGYALVMLQVLDSQKYTDTYLIETVKFLHGRNVTLSRMAVQEGWYTDRQGRFYRIMRTSNDLGNLREFCRRVLTKNWCIYNLGF